MVRDYYVSRLPFHGDLFGDSERKFQIIIPESVFKELCTTLRHVVGNAKYRPITNNEQDVLCDLYNSLSLINLK